MVATGAPASMPHRQFSIAIVGGTVASHGSREFSEVSRSGAHSKPAALRKKIHPRRRVALGVSSAQRHVERFHRRPGRVVSAVPVNIARDRDRAMPKQVGDLFDVHAAL
jgi:hypothetical protein